MTDIPESSHEKPKLAVFHNLPVGGGISVAGSLLRQLEHFFSITVHYPEGSSSLNLPESISMREWPFPQGRRISGFRKLAAPLSLPSRLRSFDRLCSNISEEINSFSDLVLVHNSMFIAAPPVLKYLRVPSVYFCYEFPRHLYEPELIRRTENGFSRLLLSHLRSLETKMDKEAISYANAIATLSGWMKKRIVDIYGLESTVVRPGVDTEFFNIERNSVKKNFVLSIGALWPFKGHEMAISALSCIKPDIRPSLVIVADREFPGYCEKLKRTAAELEVDLNLERGISKEKLKSLYLSGQAVLCCQHNEPYGLVPLEAMACGMPVVAVKEGGFIDNLRSGKNGILVKRDPVEMAGALERILTYPHLRNKLISGGREFVTNERTTATAAGKLVKLLKSMIV